LEDPLVNLLRASPTESGLNPRVCGYHHDIDDPRSFRLLPSSWPRQVAHQHDTQRRVDTSKPRFLPWSSRRKSSVVNEAFWRSNLYDRESRLFCGMMASGDFVLISPFRRSANVDSIDLVAVSLVIISAGFVWGIGRTYGTLTDRLCVQNPEFWADYQYSLRVAVESQHKNRAKVTRSSEKLLPPSSR
jgi:hypothetical protein